MHLYADINFSKIDLDSKCNIFLFFTFFSEPGEAMEVLGNLSKTVLPAQVSFQQMTNLMHRCEVLDLMQRYDIKKNIQPKSALHRANIFGTNALNLLSGIYPGNYSFIAYWCYSETTEKTITVPFCLSNEMKKKKVFRKIEKRDSRRGNTSCRGR